jgi:hypothetical protein
VQNILTKSFRVSPIEIGLVLIIILIFFGASRAIRMGEKLGHRNAQVEKAGRTKKETPPRSSKGQWLGIFLAIIGAAILFIAFKGFSLLTSLTFWGAIVIALGATVFIISRRR